MSLEFTTKTDTFEASDNKVDKDKIVFQSTVARSVQFRGRGIHSGCQTTLAVLPAGADTGITFVRVDLPGSPEIAATHQRIVSSDLCTVLAGEAGATVQTVEHILAALAGLRIDNARLELNGPEVPSMDGSAREFCTALLAAGRTRQDGFKRVYRILRPISIEDKLSRVLLRPGEGFSVRIDIDFGPQVIGRQIFSFDRDTDDFSRELAPARTFGFAGDIESLHARGYAHGASMDNAVVLGPSGVLNQEGFRFDDECVRHKALDVMGDLVLAGGEIIGRFEGTRPSHRLTAALLRKMFLDSTCFDLIRLDGRVSPPPSLEYAAE